MTDNKDNKVVMTPSRKQFFRLSELHSASVRKIPESDAGTNYRVRIALSGDRWRDIDEDFKTQSEADEYLQELFNNIINT